MESRKILGVLVIILVIAFNLACIIINQNRSAFPTIPVKPWSCITKGEFLCIILMSIFILCGSILIDVSIYKLCSNLVPLGLAIVLLLVILLPNILFFLPSILIVLYYLITTIMQDKNKYELINKIRSIIYVASILVPLLIPTAWYLYELKLPVDDAWHEYLYVTLLYNGKLENYYGIIKQEAELGYYVGYAKILIALANVTGIPPINIDVILAIIVQAYFIIILFKIFTKILCDINKSCSAIYLFFLSSTLAFILFILYFDRFNMPDLFRFSIDFSRMEEFPLTWGMWPYKSFSLYLILLGIYIIMADVNLIIRLFSCLLLVFAIYVYLGSLILIPVISFFLFIFKLQKRRDLYSSSKHIILFLIVHMLLIYIFMLDFGFSESLVIRFGTDNTILIMLIIFICTMVYVYDSFLGRLIYTLKIIFEKTLNKNWKTPLVISYLISLLLAIIDTYLLILWISNPVSITECPFDIKYIISKYPILLGIDTLIISHSLSIEGFVTKKRLKIVVSKHLMSVIFLQTLFHAMLLVLPFVSFSELFPCYAKMRIMSMFKLPFIIIFIELLSYTKQLRLNLWKKRIFLILALFIIGSSATSNLIHFMAWKPIIGSDLEPFMRFTYKVYANKQLYDIISSNSTIHFIDMYGVFGWYFYLTLKFMLNIYDWNIYDPFCNNYTEQPEHILVKYTYNFQNDTFTVEIRTPVYGATSIIILI
ncbi:MAG: hypothetical protein QW279_00090 [Candidatus Jordarchaeaceae archaeon]